METPTATRPKYALRQPLMRRENGRAYNDAWARFWHMSARLNKLWKTKKTALQILREVRR